MSSKRFTRCPILCGKCCNRYWTNVGDITNDPKFRYKDTKGKCPHMGKAGCKLPRKDRPESCLEYFCSAALAVREKKISLQDGIYLCSEDRQDHISEWPKKLFDKYESKCGNGKRKVVLAWRNNS